jgi:uncharacterized protein (TIGR03437 family)
MHTNRYLRVALYAAILVSLSFSLQAATPKIGGGTCSTSMVSGTYFYLLTGIVASNGSVASYAELGKLVADGNGGVSGQSFASIGGQQETYSLAGTYIVQSNCAGSLTLTVNSQITETLAFQVINGGLGMTVAISSSSAVVAGEVDRQTGGAFPIQCGPGSVSGGYGYLLTGVAMASGSNVSYSDAGQIVADGNGNLEAESTVNLGGAVSQVSGNGSYAIAGDCSGTASVANVNSSANYRFALVRDGQVALFFGTDTGRTVAGIVTPQFGAPSQSVVNGASFQPGAAPGSLFSIFGTGLASNPASAQSVPLPGSLGATQVLVNGSPAPLVYVSDKQINAQMPIGIPTGEPVSVSVTNAGATSNTVTVTIPPVAPGIFTYNGNQGIIQNQNGSLNSAAAPAHGGDVVVAYLTGGGSVNSAGAWFSGSPSPGGLSSVTAPYSVTVGGQPVEVEYLGLTPGFVGLYQTNFTMPSLAPGSYPIVVTVGGVSSNAVMVNVGG